MDYVEIAVRKASKGGLCDLRVVPAKRLLHLIHVLHHVGQVVRQILHTSQGHLNSSAT